MKRLLAVFALALLLGGCGTWQAITQPVHSEKAVSTEPPAVRAARVAIDEANASLTGLNNVIGQNVEAKVWTKAQAQAYQRVKNILIPNMYYRKDIGDRWFEDHDKLHSWGYLRES